MFLVFNIEFSSKDNGLKSCMVLNELSKIRCQNCFLDHADNLKDRKVCVEYAYDSEDQAIVTVKNYC